MTSELRSLLQASLPGYVIERELGGGGMSRVFTAVETALDRKAVVKVLSPELDEMDRATDARDFWPTYSSLAQRQYDPLRRSARFAAIIRRVGLDDRIFTAPGGGRPQ